VSDAVEALHEAAEALPHAANVLLVLRALAQQSRFTPAQRRRANALVTDLHRALTSAAIALDGLPTPSNPTGNQ